MIDSFQGEYRFLSNFYPSPVLMYGLEYQTVEHAYQAAKSADQITRLQISKAHGPGHAKKLGQKVVLRPDWDEFRLVAMQTLVTRKFEIVSLADRLIATGDEELVEGNQWGDKYWGVCNGVGENHLGKILMAIRGRLQ